MKVPPKRKGNLHPRTPDPTCSPSLNESPSEKEGKSGNGLTVALTDVGLNESPSEKEGKSLSIICGRANHQSLNESPSEKEGKCSEASPNLSRVWASMKVPPKRKGNTGLPKSKLVVKICLNESPSEKEGKFPLDPLQHLKIP